MARRSRAARRRAAQRRRNKQANAQRWELLQRANAERDPEREPRQDPAHSRPRRAARMQDVPSWEQLASRDTRPQQREHVGATTRTLWDSQPFLANGLGPVRRYRAGDTPAPAAVKQAVVDGTARVLACGTVQCLHTGRFIPGHYPDLYAGA